MTRCRYCNRKLTDPESIAAEAGDVCRQKHSDTADTGQLELFPPEPKRWPAFLDRILKKLKLR